MPKALLIFECILAFISVCLGVVCCMFTLNRKYELSLWVKSAASICFLILGSINALKSTDSIFALLILAGLFLGFAGDVFLALNNMFRNRGNFYFLCGIISFFMGHVLYCVAVAERFGVSVWGFLYAAVLLGIIYLLTRWQGVNAGKMQIPGTVYMAAVCMTAGFGFHFAITSGSASSILFAVGGFLFASSDTILTIYSFGKKKHKMLEYLILLTYYPAQCLIAISLLLLEYI